MCVSRKLSVQHSLWVYVAPLSSSRMDNALGTKTATQVTVELKRSEKTQKNFQRNDTLILGVPRRFDFELQVARDCSCCNNQRFAWNLAN